jgi:hypothetical protein
MAVKARPVRVGSSRRREVGSDLDGLAALEMRVTKEHAAGLVGRDEAAVLGALIRAGGRPVGHEDLARALGWRRQAWAAAAGRLVLNLRRFLESTRTRVRIAGSGEGYRLVVGARDSLTE